MISPEVGWMAARLIGYGRAISLAMLGIAVTLESGTAGDDQINDFYTQLASTDDSVFVVNEHYRALEAQYPFLSGFLGGVTRWTEQPQYNHYANVRRAAKDLSQIQWSSFESVPLGIAPALIPDGYSAPVFGACGDILGSVFSQMTSIGARRKKVFDFVPVPFAMMELIADDRLPKGGVFVDAWCGSGTRAIAYLRLCDMFEIPPEKVVLNDPNAMHIAMAGLNMVACQAQVPIEMHQSRAWADLWAAGQTTFESRSKSYRKNLPPELAQDTEIALEELGS